MAGNAASESLKTPDIAISGNKENESIVQKQRIGYVYSQNYVTVCDLLPKVTKRASLVHSLIEAYGLLDDLCVIEPKRASAEALTAFHGSDYVDYLEWLNDTDEDEYERYTHELQEYGLGYDCLPFRGVFTLSSATCGATMRAAEFLVNRKCDITINWGGGWHHAKKDEASGYCFLNDCVLGILKLRQHFDRVVYVDLDLHHGDGVEEAFLHTDHVMTVSFHHHASGFFPGTGDVSEVGLGRGRFHTVNVPLREGLNDDTFTEVFTRVMVAVREQYRPDVIVCQCGADGLAGDPMATWNLTHEGLACCLQTLAAWRLPMLVLGGGGYNLSNTAKCWTHVTGRLLGRVLDTDIPDHEYFTLYGPDYEIGVAPNLRKDLNDSVYVQSLLDTVEENLNAVK